MIDKGSAVLDRDGHEVGLVENVRLVPGSDQLEGLDIRLGGPLRTLFPGGDVVSLSADLIDSIELIEVRLRIGKGVVDELSSVIALGVLASRAQAGLGHRTLIHSRLPSRCCLRCRDNRVRLLRFIQQTNEHGRANRSRVVLASRNTHPEQRWARLLQFPGCQRGTSMIAPVRLSREGRRELEADLASLATERSYSTQLIDHARQQDNDPTKNPDLFDALDNLALIEGRMAGLRAFLVSA